MTHWSHLPQPIEVGGVGGGLSMVWGRECGGGGGCCRPQSPPLMPGQDFSCSVRTFCRDLFFFFFALAVSPECPVWTTQTGRSRLEERMKSQAFVCSKPPACQYMAVMCEQDHGMALFWSTGKLSTDLIWREDGETCSLSGGNSPVYYFPSFFNTNHCWRWSIPFLKIFLHDVWEYFLPLSCCSNMLFENLTLFLKTDSNDIIHEVAVKTRLANKYGWNMS